MDKLETNGAISAMPSLKDPVCGMKVTEQSEPQAGHVGKRYYFCSAGCKANPEDYTTVNPVGVERKPVTTPTAVQLPASMAASTFTNLGLSRDDLYLPDAFGNPAGQTWQLPNLPHDTGTFDTGAGRRGQQRATRFSAPLPVAATTHGGGAGADDGGADADWAIYFNKCGSAQTRIQAKDILMF